MLVARLAVAVLTISAIALVQSPAAFAQAKQPPSCAAISFRALPAGVGEGDQEAGLYKSRFGQIVVKGTVKNGQVQTYYVTVNGKTPEAAPTAPASAAACAAAKKLPAPGQAMQACTGDRLRVMIDREGGKRYVALYALQGRKWQFCSGATA